MKIESYGFKKIVIDQTEYDRDLLILPDRVHTGWWREQGHSLSAADLSEVFAAAPEVIVIGTGYFGLMQVPSATRDEIVRRGIELHVLPTTKAWEKYNVLAQEGRRVGAALHLAC